MTRLVLASLLAVGCGGTTGSALVRFTGQAGGEQRREDEAGHRVPP